MGLVRSGRLARASRRRDSLLDKAPARLALAEGSQEEPCEGRSGHERALEQHHAASDRRPHNLLDRPRDAPWRTAIGLGVFSWVLMIFLAGASDRVLVLFHVSYVAQIWVYRVLIWVVPLVVCFTTKRLCDELRAHERLVAERERAEQESSSGDGLTRTG